MTSQTGFNKQLELKILKYACIQFGNTLVTFHIL